MSNSDLLESALPDIELLDWTVQGSTERPIIGFAGPDGGFEELVSLRKNGAGGGKSRSGLRAKFRFDFNKTLFMPLSESKTMLSTFWIS
jgi:hypothetical protein